MRRVFLVGGLLALVGRATIFAHGSAAGALTSFGIFLACAVGYFVVFVIQ